MTLKLLAFSVFLSTISAYAQSGASSVQSETRLREGSRFESLLLGLKSFNSSGRLEVMDRDTKAADRGQTLSGKQEFYIGYREPKAWGVMAQFTQYRYEYNNPAYNKWAVSDPSFSLIHPDFEFDDLKVLGLFRVYTPFTSRSKTKNIYQYAYYSTQLYSMPKGRELFNQFIPRWFTEPTYSARDTQFYIEDRTMLTTKLNSWARWGVGHWSQYEQHASSPDGYCSELIISMDYMISHKVFMGPRLSLPVFSQHSVYDGPLNATLGQGRAELYFQATL